MGYLPIQPSPWNHGQKLLHGPMAPWAHGPMVPVVVVEVEVVVGAAEVVVLTILAAWKWKTFRTGEHPKIPTKHINLCGFKCLSFDRPSARGRAGWGLLFPNPHLNIKTYGQTRPHQRPAPSHPNMSGNCPDSEGPRFKDDRGCLQLKGCTCCEKCGAHIYIYYIILHIYIYII